MSLKIYKHYARFPVKKISDGKFEYKEKIIEVDKSEFKNWCYPDHLEEAVDAIKFMSFFVFDDAKGLENWLNHGGGQCDFSAETYWQNVADISKYVTVDRNKVEEFKKKHNLKSYDPVKNLCKKVLLVSLNIRGDIRNAAGNVQFSTKTAFLPNPCYKLDAVD